LYKTLEVKQQPHQQIALSVVMPMAAAPITREIVAEVLHMPGSRVLVHFVN
jgi:hypothetical protein